MGQVSFTLADITAVKEREAVDSKEQKRAAEKMQTDDQNYLVCQVCGSRIKPETSTWDEDDEGLIFCKDCRAERESCGCSD